MFFLCGYVLHKPMYPYMVPREGPGEQTFGGWRGALKRACMEMMQRLHRGQSQHKGIGPFRVATALSSQQVEGQARRSRTRRQTGDG